MALKQFFTALVFFSLVDFLWIGLIANRFYLRQFGDLARQHDGKFAVVYWAAVGVYLLLALATTKLALPLAAEGGVGASFLYGALVGFCVYGVYDLTNHATLRRWPIALLATDMAWGTFLCGAVSAATMWISLKFY